MTAKEYIKLAKSLSSGWHFYYGDPGIRDCNGRCPLEVALGKDKGTIDLRDYEVGGPEWDVVSAADERHAKYRDYLLNELGLTELEREDYE